MDDVAARLAALEARVDHLEDLNAIRRLQMAYGYYIDYNRPEEVAGLFARDGAVVFLSGEYRGHAGVMRLYGTWFQNLFTGGRRGPVKGLLLDHFQPRERGQILVGGSALGRFGRGADGEIGVDGHAMADVAPDLGGDGTAPVPTLGAVALVPEPDHQRLPGARDAADVPSRRRRFAREPVAGQ